MRNFHTHAYFSLIFYKHGDDASRIPSNENFTIDFPFHLTSECWQEQSLIARQPRQVEV